MRSWFSTWQKTSGYRNMLTLTEWKTKVGFTIFIILKSPHKINSKLKQLITKSNLIVKSIIIDNKIEFEKICNLAK
ncbi:hypothetical protein [Mycoplasma phocimorsus]|uniref:hypothetical protein n=1 Tax=Mycoplasma phocimorsus TaxID=3045839 RepID=UPI0024BF81EE|nr:hypothetical protein [Mycoplasma phocimorsus]MDJ1647606.1 hypothetical protein [Mycoplasma phocimorsus]